MKKRIYAFLLALCLVLNMTSGIAFATEGDENAHTPGEQKTVVPATCTEEGQWAVYCTDPDCGIELESGTIEMLPHTPEQEACQNDHVDPTCTEKGHNWLHCSACKKLLHEVDGKFVVCNEGENCETCYIPATGHNYVTTEAVDPTCTEPGHNEYRACEVCGAYEEGHEKEEIEANGHGEPIPAEDYVLQCDPDADDEHSYDYSVPAVCSVCGETLESEIVVYAPHTWEDKEGLEPTCTEPGYTEYKQCSVCGRIEGQNEIEPLGHKYVWVDGKAGSCTEDGCIAGLICDVCGEPHPDPELGAVIVPTPGHVSEVVEGYAATCTETGLTDGEKCSVCGETLVEQEIIPANGHSFDKHVLGKLATCTESGYTAHSECIDCGAIKWREEDGQFLPAHGHSYEDGYYPETSQTIADETAGKVRCHETDGIEDYIVSIPAVEPTCNEIGNTAELRCSFCQIVAQESEDIPALGHDWELTVPGTLPTCTETGISDKWDCSRCDAEFGGEIINARGHMMVSVEETLPTCDTKGNFAYDYCSVCGYATNEEYLNENGVDEMIEPKLAGTEFDEVINTIGQIETEMPEEGHPEAFIVDSYAEYDAEKDEWVNHKYVEDVVALAPTCTEDGIKEGATRCVICGAYFELNLIPATGHAVETVEGYNAICTNDGLKNYSYCATCGKACEGIYESEETIQALLTSSEVYMPEEGDPAEFVIPALGHDAQPGVALDPTCTEDGHTAGLYCARCNLTIEAFETIPALGHEMVETQAEIPAGCTTEGLTAIFGCTRCDHTEGGAVIPATNHDAGEVTPVIPATCTEHGFSEGAHCTKCEVNYAPVYEYLTGNGYIGAEDLFEAGWLKVPVLIDPLDHDLSDPVTAAPTCTEQGYDNYSECQREGCDHYEGSIIPELGHDWVVISADEQPVAPTCTKAGYTGEIKQCLRCRETEAVVVAALGHDWVHVDAVEATCAAAGNIEYDYCARCGLYLVEGVEHAEYDVVVEDDGLHDNLMHVDAEMATCQDNGHSDGQYCDVCGYTNYTVIEADADAYHTYLTENKDALLADGTLEWIVIDEGDNVTPGSGYQAVQCPCCGYNLDVKEYPEVQLGDVNNDGKVNSRDARDILQYLAGLKDDLANEKAADFNQDGKISSRDAAAILNYLAGF